MMSLVRLPYPFFEKLDILTIHLENRSQISLDLSYSSKIQRLPPFPPSALHYAHISADSQSWTTECRF